MKPVPPSVAQIRREVCERHNCREKLNYDDPCAKCPNGHWGKTSLQCGRAVAAPESRSEASPAPVKVRGGVGTELKALLRWFGIKEALGCACRQRAELMDRKGIRWCTQNTSLIVKWMAEEAERRKLRFARPAAYLLVWAAIGLAWAKSLLH